MRVSGALRSFLTASAEMPQQSCWRVVATSAVAPPEAAQNEMIRQEVATQKLKSLAAAEKERDESAAVDRELLMQLAPHVRDGTVGAENLLEGLKKGDMTQHDLRRLMEMEALSPFMHRHIQTALHGGMAKLSLVEMMELLKMKRVGMDDVTRVMQRGDLSEMDVEFLVSKQLIPSDVAKVVLGEKEGDEQSAQSGFSKAKESLAAGGASKERLGLWIVDGDLHPDDVSLLVAENLLTESEAEKILDRSANEVLEVYEEAEKFAELVGNGRFTFEELEVMRGKGALGASLVHYLVMRNALGDKQGQALLKIEEDSTYYDPEVTDDEIEMHLPEMNYTPQTPEPEEAEAETKPTDASEAQEDEEEESILSKGGVSDEGFYPEGIDKDDIWSLWEYLVAVYGDTSAALETLDSLHEEETYVRRKVIKKATERPRLTALPETSMDASGAVSSVGRRKSSVAKVTMKTGTGNITVNDKPLHDYFQNLDGRCYVLSPFLATNTLGQFDVNIAVEGGGWSGQSQAIRHGIARALQRLDPQMQGALKELGLLRHDSRLVERKKPGRAKARKSFQWVKR